MVKTNTTDMKRIEPFPIPRPTACISNPGQSFLNDEWKELKLVKKNQEGPKSYMFTFELPKDDITEEGQSLNLSTAACVIALPSGGKIERGKSGDYERYIPPVDKKTGQPFKPRSYTPISTNKDMGYFQLLVKIYSKGSFTQWLSDQIPGKSTVMFCHLETNVKIQYPFGQPKKIGMIVGGTGITPMIQILHAVLGTQGNTMKSYMLYGSTNQDDILAKRILDNWMLHESDRLSVTHILSKEDRGTTWKGFRGFVNTKLLIEQVAADKFPAPADECLIFVCGPPHMINAICGRRHGVPSGFCRKLDFSGMLKDFGYHYGQVYRF